MNRYTMAASLMLALSACACGTGNGDMKSSADSSNEAVSRKVSAKDLHFTKGAASQIARMEWVRPATWKSVRMDVLRSHPVPAMISTDGAGSRILALNGSAGYDIFRIDLDCSRNRYAVIEARHANRDDRPPMSPLKAGLSRVSPSEIKRICSGKNVGSMDGTAFDAVAALRQVGPPDLRTRPQISSEERARMWQEYKQKNGIK